ncbi:MAG: NAD(P)/FAD-dependent oxidoreductase [Acidobacteriota bacterium]|nr:NAD(P)/FAD-dependent oxidoreductase [Acidobacteriota bacterium]
MQQYDVAIIGAGLAGLHTARLLGARGISVLLVDRKDSLASPVHTTGIFVRKTWEDFPLPDEQLGAPIRDVFLHSPAGRRIHLAAEQDEFRIGRMQWIYVSMLEACSRAGVRWLPSSRVVACRPGSITLVRRDHIQEFPVRFVIGADGARSLVARQLGLDQNSDFLVGLEMIAGSRSEPALHCFLDPRIAPGYIAWVACDGETAHVGVAGDRNRFNPASALETFRHRVKDLAGGRVIERRGGLIPVNGVLRRIANDRGLLVGDAAGAVSPLTAGGLDGAMRLSSLAAEVTAAYLERNDASILREYDGARFRTRFLARRWMRRLLRVAGNPLMTEIAFAAMMTPPLRAFARHVFFSRGGSFPEIGTDHLMFARNHSTNAG